MLNNNQQPGAGLPATPKRAAVLGHPISHSLSPVLHNAAYAALGLDGWTYDAIDTTIPQLPDVLAELDESWAGLSLTMPLKFAVLPLVDALSDTVVATGVANTVVVDNDTDPAGLARLVAHNTDVAGIVAAIREVLRHGPVESAAVLGNGATAASTLAALQRLGCNDVVVYARTQDDPAPLQAAADRLGVRIEARSLDIAASELAGYDVVVSTMPAHAGDPIAAALTEAGGVLLDVIYDPNPTDLIATWSALGGAIVTGERMLLHQAAKQVELMTGHPAPLPAMDAALQAALTDNVE